MGRGGDESYQQVSENLHIEELRIYMLSKLFIMFLRRRTELVLYG